MVLDPDAPDREGDGSNAAKFGPWLHWLLTDCTGGSCASGSEAVGYNGPTPPKGNHRYVFLLFKQTGDGGVSVANTDRKAWNVSAFLKQNSGLELVGFQWFYCSAV